MKITFQYDNYTIEVFDDFSFSQNPDSGTQYEKIYEPEIDKEFKPSSQHAIVVYNGEKQVSSAILLASAGATSVTHDSALIDNRSLIVRCCNVIFCLTIPQLNLNWLTEADPITCFSIHEYKGTYISHGEISICRIDRQGSILWQYGGKDIFLKLEEDDCFVMNENSITLKDFSGAVYEIDYDGNTLSMNELKKEKEKKPWWRF